jgi:pimeloyl-ACP methyl ester carboxylesterase
MIPPGSIAPATLPISISISWRGWIAAELSVRNTARLASLTLGCAVGISLDGMTMGDVFRMSPEENARRFYVDAERAKARLERLASADPQILVRNRSMVVRLGYPRFLNPDLAKWLHRIDVPTLLLWGEADGLVPVVFGEAYRRVIPGAQLVIIPSAGHAPFEEQPDAFLSGFAQFLSNRGIAPISSPT